MGTSRRIPEPEKVPVPTVVRPSALELKVEELEEKGLIRILRGPGDVVSIEILPGAAATPSGDDAQAPRVSTDSPSTGVQELHAGKRDWWGWGWGGKRDPGREGYPGDRPSCER
jgi:hypothetical protein